MTFKLTTALLFVLLCSFSPASAQTGSNKEMISKLDSIVKVTKLNTGVIKYHQVTSVNGQVSSDSYSLSKRERFTFDGPFLRFSDRYFNINKLIFFIVNEKQGYIEFYFQGY